MSSISFASQSGGTIRISGRERSMMESVCDSFRQAQTGDFKYDNLSWLKHICRPGHYLHSKAIQIEDARDANERALLLNQLASALDTWLRAGYDDSVLAIDGAPVQLFSMKLNSAITWGNRAVQLCAKLHGQCEIHAYCEGADRSWLADVIQEGIDCHVFSPEPMGYDGWPKLIDFLRASDGEPVVTSYSVTDSFPSADSAPQGVLPLSKDGEIDWDAWYEIPPAQQWEWGIAKLRSEPGLRISPDQLGDLFGSGITGREFIRRACAAVETAVECR